MAACKAHRGQKVTITGDSPYESAIKRRRRKMCDWCVKGRHECCPEEECPCVCNDIGFKFSHHKASGIGLPVLIQRTVQQSESDSGITSEILKRRYV